MMRVVSGFVLVLSLMNCTGMASEGDPVLSYGELSEFTLGRLESVDAELGGDNINSEFLMLDLCEIWSLSEELASRIVEDESDASEALYGKVTALFSSLSIDVSEFNVDLVRRFPSVGAGRLRLSQYYKPSQVASQKLRPVSEFEVRMRLLEFDRRFLRVVSRVEGEDVDALEMMLLYRELLNMGSLLPVLYDVVSEQPRIIIRTEALKLMRDAFVVVRL